MTKNWKQIQAEVKQLYMIEGKSLLEVRELMREKYSFQASVRAYKLRFEQWGYQKYNTKSHCKHTGTGRDARESSHNRTTVPTTARASRLLIQSDSLAMVQSISGSRLKQRSFLSSSLILSLPDDLKDMDAISRGIHDYFSGSFGAGIWRPDGFWTLAYSGPEERRFQEATSNVFETFRLMIKLLERSEGKLAGLVLRKAFILLEKASTEDDPVSLVLTFVLAAFLTNEGRHEIVAYLLRHIEALTAFSHPSRHPRVHIFRALCDSKMDRLELIRLAWNYAIGQLKIHLGADHMMLIEYIIGYGLDFNMSDLSEEEKRQIHTNLKLLTSPQIANKLDYFTKTRIHMSLMDFIDYGLKEPERAERVAEFLVRELKTHRYQSNVEELTQDLYAYLATKASIRGERDVAVGYWYEAIRYASYCDDEYDPSTIRYILSLEKELEALGDNEKCAIVRQRRLGFLQGFLEG